MEVLVLIGVLLFAAAAGYLAMDRLGRFLDGGGISPYWDEEAERLDRRGSKEPVRLDVPPRQEGCNNPHSKVV